MILYGRYAGYGKVGSGEVEDMGGDKWWDSGSPVCNLWSTHLLSGRSRARNGDSIPGFRGGGGS